MKGIKKILAVLMAICIFVTHISAQGIMEAKATNQASDEVTVVSLVCEPVEIIEKSNGYYTTGYHPETNEAVEYYYYNNFNPKFTVTFSDGTTYTNQQSSIEHNGQWYWVNVMTDQSATNPWGPGTHTATAQLGDATVDMTINIVESPVVSLVCEDVTVIEKTGGYYTTGYHPETNEAIEYYYYSNFNPKYTITFSDGTVYSGTGGFEYEGTYYWPNIVTEQNCLEPWGVGQHKATINVMGYESEFTVSVTKSPFASMKIDDIEIIEQTNGYETTDYDWQTDTYKSYYRYEYIFSKAEITLEDGNIITTNNTYFMHDGNSYNISLSAEQSSSNPWGLGGHTVTARFAGVESTYKMNIVESPYAAIEVLQVSPIVENENGYHMNGVFRYYTPDFSYKLTRKDGTSEIKYYTQFSHGNVTDNIVTVSDDQETNPWTPEGENYFTVTAPVGLIAKGKAQFKEAPPYKYYEKDGEIYFQGFRKKQGTVAEIPAEIDGKPVVSVEGLDSNVTECEQLVIPDSVRIINTNFYSNAETISIGKNVTNIDADMFKYCGDLTSIIVSEDNPYYCSVDGIVYDKNMETLIAYPVAKGDEYIVPASVKDVGIMLYSQYQHIKLSFEDGPSAFVEEDGLIYNRDKTKVYFCDKGKKGEVVLPNTVLKIDKFAFENCKLLTSVTIPNGVTELAYATFGDCSSLVEVKLPETLKAIGGYAFANCDKLENINLPNSLEKIATNAFSYSGLKEIAIPNKVKLIGIEAFWGTPLEKINLGTSVETIEDNAFANTKIEQLTIPDSVKSLGKEAFISCGRLEKVVIGSNLRFVPESCFWNCSSLSKVVFLNNQVTVGDFAFDGCPIEDVNMENVKEFGQYAFSRSELKTVAIAQGVTEIAYGAFRNSSNLATIDVPETVLKIEGHVFDETAWYDMQEEGSVYLEHIFYAYNGALPSDGVLNIKDGTTVIADYALEEQNRLSKVNLPEGLLTIGDYAFFNCSGLTEITIPESVSYIGEFAFEQCSSLTNIYVDPDNPYYSSINGVLFDKTGTELMWCPKQVDDTYVVPESVTNIKSFAFSLGDNLTVHIENVNTTLERAAIGYRCFGRVNSTIACYANAKAYEYAKDNLIYTEILTPKVMQVAVHTMPNKTEYERGETFDSTGLSLLATYSNGVTEVVTEGFEVGEFDSATSGQKGITISYGDLTTEFVVNVKVPTVQNIAIKKLPEKTDYCCGEQLNLEGLQLLVAYSDGTDETVTSGYEVAEVNMSTSGIHQVTITYGGKAVTFDIVVKQSGTAILDSVKGKAGEIVEVTLTFENVLNVKSLAISQIVYDTDNLQLIDGTWNVNGVLSDWNAEDNCGVLAFNDNTKVDTAFFTLKFKISEEASDGEVAVNCSVMAKEMFENGEEVDIKLECVAGKVTVYSVIPGDVDGNEVMNTDDAIYVLYHTFTPNQYPTNQDCDFNGDGEINSDDAIYLLYHIMLLDKYPLVC